MLLGVQTMVTGERIGALTPVLKQRMHHGRAVFVTGMQPLRRFLLAIRLLGAIKPASRMEVVLPLKHPFQHPARMSQATVHKASLQNILIMKV